MTRRTVTISGLTEAIRAVEDLEETMSEKCEQIAMMLAEIGVQVASAHYESAPYAGTKDVEISIDDSGDKGTVIVHAGGTATLFIEFGTGVFNADAYDARSELKSSAEVVGHGEYGQKRAESPFGWIYYGDFPAQPPAGTSPVRSHGSKPAVHTYGEQAHPFMYEGRKAMIANIREIVREVFEL